MFHEEKKAFNDLGKHAAYITNKAPHESFHIVCVVLLLTIICVIRKIYNKRKQNGLFLTICGRSSYLLSRTCTLESRNTDTHEDKYNAKQQ